MFFYFKQSIFGSFLLHFSHFSAGKASYTRMPHALIPPGFPLTVVILTFLVRRIAPVRTRGMPFKITTYPAGTAKKVINPSAAATSAIPIHLRQLVPIKGPEDIYPAFLRSEIFKTFFNSLFDGNQCIETTDLKNFINILI